MCPQARGTPNLGAFDCAKCAKLPEAGKLIIFAITLSHTLMGVSGRPGHEDSSVE